MILIHQNDLFDIVIAIDEFLAESLAECVEINSL